MTCISANWLLLCDKDFTILEDSAIVFDEKIIAMDSIENIKKQYPKLTMKHQGENSVIMPGLINAHVHLEFSANKTSLKYGNFVQWLFSVIQHREDLVEKATKELIDEELNNMILSGTTSIGAISSYGFDMQSCLESPLNVVYFIEALGSKQDMIDTLFLDFQEKLKSALANKSDSFIPAIAIHSPYATHPFLIREILNIARQKDMPVSAHFQESKAENDWLNYSSGEFAPFFNDMLNQSVSMTKPEEFLNLFKNISTLSFTHCVEANKNELEQIRELKASIIHCPNSNRLLNNTLLILDNTRSINKAMGTDGLSSNNSLNLFKEMHNALFMHTNYLPEEFAKELLTYATIGGAKTLGLKNKGILKGGYDADIITITLPDKIEDKNALASAIILHTKNTKNTYIKGKDAIL